MDFFLKNKVSNLLKRKKTPVITFVCAVKLGLIVAVREEVVPVHDVLQTRANSFAFQRGVPWHEGQQSRQDDIRCGKRSSKALGAKLQRSQQQQQQKYEWKQTKREIRMRLYCNI